MAANALADAVAAAGDEHYELFHGIAKGFHRPQGVLLCNMVVLPIANIYPTCPP
jgi:hypothetical protein